MGSLQSAEISDLPTVLKFIHEYMTPRHAQDVASEIRLKINLDFNPVPVISSTPRLTQPKYARLGLEFFLSFLHLKKIAH